jgi:hypothetical protein
MTVASIGGDNTGFLGPQPDSQTSKFMMIDGEVHEIHKIVVHKFINFDDDPDIFIAADLHDWENSEQGIWIKEHAVETPQWAKMPDYVSLGTRVVIIAKLKEKDVVYYRLRWGV